MTKLVPDDYVRALQGNANLSELKALLHKYSVQSPENKRRLWLIDRTVRSLLGIGELPEQGDVATWAKHLDRDILSLGAYLSASSRQRERTEICSELFEVLLESCQWDDAQQARTETVLVAVAVAEGLVIRREEEKAIDIIDKALTNIMTSTINTIGYGALYRLVNMGLRLGVVKASQLAEQHALDTEASDSSIIHYQAGEILALSGNLKQAEKRFIRAHSCDDNEIRKEKIGFAIGFAELLQGKVSLQALRKYESRLLFRDRPYKSLKLWEGEGYCTVVVYADQGIGDQAFFMRFAEYLQDTYPQTKFVFELGYRMKDLAKELAPNARVYASGDRVEGLDVTHVLPLSSMPYYLAKAGRSPEDFAKTMTIGRKKPNRNGIRENPVIGIIWKSTNAREGAMKSVFIGDIVNLLGSSIPKGELVSLQHNLTGEELDICFKKRISDKYNECRTFLEIYNMIRGFDAFVGVCGSATHIAAIAGIPTFVLKPKGHISSYSWATQNDGRTSQWYGDNTLIYTQSEPGNWTIAIDSLSNDLAEWSRDFSRPFKHKDLPE